MTSTYTFDGPVNSTQGDKDKSEEENSAITVIKIFSALIFGEKPPIKEENPTWKYSQYHSDHIVFSPCKHLQCQNKDDTWGSPDHSGKVYVPKMTPKIKLIYCEDIDVHKGFMNLWYKTLKRKKCKIEELSPEERESDEYKSLCKINFDNSCDRMVYDQEEFTNLYNILLSVCNETEKSNEMLDAFVDCGVISLCAEFIVFSKIPTGKYLKMCIRLINAIVATKHNQATSEIIKKHKVLIYELCKLYNAFPDVPDKCLVLNLFNGIVLLALTLDDDFFEAMFYKVCHVINNTCNETILLKAVICLDNFIELYQEWEVNKRLLAMGIAPKLTSKLCCENEDLLFKLLRCLGNLLSAESFEINKSVIWGGILPHFQSLLLHKNKEVVCTTVWAISNVAAGPDHSTKYFFDYHVVPFLLHYLQCKDGKMANEALWVLANLIEDASVNEKWYILSNFAILKAVVECLSADKDDMQGPAIENLVYLELLRDTFQTIFNCISNAQNKDDKYNVFKLDSIRKNITETLESVECYKKLQLIAKGECPTGTTVPDELKANFEQLVSEYQKILVEFKIYDSSFFRKFSENETDMKQGDNC